MALLKTKSLSLLIQAVRWQPVRPLVAFLFKTMLPLMPFERLAENDHWMAFHHPQPDYPLHILILPRQYMASIEDATGEDPEFHKDFYLIVQSLVAQFGLNDHGYRLVTNGGPNQQIPYWHWHLISDLDGNNPT